MLFGLGNVPGRQIPQCTEHLSRLRFGVRAVIYCADWRMQDEFLPSGLLRGRLMKREKRQKNLDRALAERNLTPKKGLFGTF